jgi:hypothetical protein
MPIRWQPRWSTWRWAWSRPRATWQRRAWLPGSTPACLGGRAAEVLAQGRPPFYPQSLAAVTQLAFGRLRADDPAAADLAGICAFLAAEPVPAKWFADAAAYLPRPLAASVADPVA